MSTVTPLRPKTAAGFPASPEALPKVSLKSYRLSGPAIAALNDLEDEAGLPDVTGQAHSIGSGEPPARHTRPHGSDVC
jgi:hypothetical protein